MTATLTLHQPPAPPGWGPIPNLSPFCIKVETYLKMAGVPYRVAPADMREAPKGKIPYVRNVEGQLLADSGFIVEHLERSLDQPVDGQLTPEQRAQGHVLRRAVEEGTYFYVAWLRWGAPTSYEYVRSAFKTFLPPVIGGAIMAAIKRSFVAKMTGQGVGRHTREEVVHLLKEDLAAYSMALGDKPFFLGDMPATVDATMYAFLLSVLQVPWDAEDKAFARSLPNLVAYEERMRRRYWAS